MKSGKSFVQVLVVVFPLILIAMVIGGILLYEQRRVDKQPEHPMAQQVTSKGLQGHYIKLRDFMSPRGFGDESEIKRLSMTTAFIDGTLSPINTGMHVESEIVLKEAGFVWKDYKIEFEGKENPLNLTVNYLDASNVELAVALSIAEALPAMKLTRECTITFSPKGESSIFADWLIEAQKRGRDHPLFIDGVDWNYLIDQIRDFITDLS